MIGIAGAGAFGTALALALARHGQEVVLWARDAAQASAMQRSRENTRHLAGFPLPAAVHITPIAADLHPCRAVLLAVPMQSLAQVLQDHLQDAAHLPLIACCKGVDMASLRGPSAVIRAQMPNACIGVLTGPSFASDIARGLPTALTLACAAPQAPTLQDLLSTPYLRLYLSDDVIGAELGGALKNVIAIAAGVVMGAGLGASARAAIMTRGFGEMQRLSVALGARAETLTGLSGLGDLVLTCASDQSRNYRYGFALGAQHPIDNQTTVEGKFTAQAAARLCAAKGMDMPVLHMIAALVAGDITPEMAASQLMSRPLTKE